jgi:tyrosyl-tRNA synthetase
VDPSPRDLAKEVEFPAVGLGSARLVDVLFGILGEKSKSQVRRLLRQGAVKVDGEKVLDEPSVVNFTRSHLFEVGKHIVFRTEPISPRLEAEREGAGEGERTP